MEDNLYKGGGIGGLMRNLCFMAFGITAFLNPLDRLNLYNICFGIIIGMLFGWLFKRFSRGLLSLFNPKLKKEKGKAVIYNAVDSGMLFLIPFALMVLMSSFYLKWSMTSGFISAGIMAVGTASAIEIGKLRDKPGIKNTIIISGVSFLFSFIWTFSVGFLAKGPGFIEGGINILRAVISKGGGSL